MSRIELRGVGKSFGATSVLNDISLTIDSGEAWVRQLHIPPYEQGNRWNPDPVRPRKLLLHEREIHRLDEAVSRKGHTLIPLKLYFSRGHAKLLVGVARGKKSYDKRHAMAERDAQREIERYCASIGQACSYAAARDASGDRSGGKGVGGEGASADGAGVRGASADRARPAPVGTAAARARDLGRGRPRSPHR